LRRRWIAGSSPATTTKKCSRLDLPSGRPSSTASMDPTMPDCV